MAALVEGCDAQALGLLAVVDVDGRVGIERELLCEALGLLLLL